MEGVQVEIAFYKEHTHPEYGASARGRALALTLYLDDVRTSLELIRKTPHLVPAALEMLTLSRLAQVRYDTLERLATAPDMDKVSDHFLSAVLVKAEQLTKEIAHQSKDIRHDMGWDS